MIFKYFPVDNSAGAASVDADSQSCLCYFLGEKLERGVLIFQYDVPSKYFPSE